MNANRSFSLPFLSSHQMKPLLLVRQSFQFGLRGIFFLTLTWIELLRAFVYLHLLIFWRIAILPIVMLSLPLRALNALYRERALEMQLCRMKTELENAMWDKKELKARLQIATRERKLMETMLMELEDEHGEAIVKIELLLGEVQNLRDEMPRLKEVQGKGLWNSDDFGKPLWKLGYNEEKRIEPVYKPTSSNNLVKGGNILAKHREIALSRSLFSAILSVIVGIIVWKAEDPCIPLVVALFSVVSMSLMSVVRYLFSIEHRPASDVVALLCCNWFILGTLAYPMLPSVARVVTPLPWSLLERTVKGLVV